jgi:hypothetical protein
MIPQALWVNQTGEDIGWGDLSCDDLKRIRNELQEGEVFIAVNHDWSCGPLEERYCPLSYIVRKTNAIIFPGKIWIVEGVYKADQIAKMIGGQIVTTEEVKNFLNVSTEAMLWDVILDKMAFWAECRNASDHLYIFQTRTNVLADDQGTSIHLSWETRRGRKIGVTFQYKNGLVCSWNFLQPGGHRHVQHLPIDTRDGNRCITREIVDLLNQWRQDQGKESFGVYTLISRKGE